MKGDEKKKKQKEKTSCPSPWKPLSAICNNSIRFFQFSGCFDIETLSRFKCGYSEAQPVSSVWKSPIIILSISVSSPQPLGHTHPQMHTCAQTHSEHTHSRTELVSPRLQWLLNSPRSVLWLCCRARNLEIMSQPPHLLQETNGLEVKYHPLCQFRGVERVDGGGGSFSGGWVHVYLL